jgi:hypothetical protein
MKQIVVFLMIFSLPFMVSAQEKKAMANKLKSITVYEQKFEKGAGKVLIETVTKYDQAGNIIEEIEYKLGKIDKHFLYKFDDVNNKILETELDASGKKTKVTEYKYANSLRTEKTVYDGNNQVLSKKTYKYETY